MLPDDGRHKRSKLVARIWMHGAVFILIIKQMLINKHNGLMIPKFDSLLRHSVHLMQNFVHFEIVTWYERKCPVIAIVLRPGQWITYSQPMRKVFPRGYPGFMMRQVGCKPRLHSLGSSAHFELGCPLVTGRHSSTDQWNSSLQLCGRLVSKANTGCQMWGEHRGKRLGFCYCCVYTSPHQLSLLCLLTVGEY